MLAYLSFYSEGRLYLLALAVSKKRKGNKLVCRNSLVEELMTSEL